MSNQNLYLCGAFSLHFFTCFSGPVQKSPRQQYIPSHANEVQNEVQPAVLDQRITSIIHHSEPIECPTSLPVLLIQPQHDTHTPTRLYESRMAVELDSDAPALPLPVSPPFDSPTRTPRPKQSMLNLSVTYDARISSPDLPAHPNSSLVFHRSPAPSPFALHLDRRVSASAAHHQQCVAPVSIHIHL